MKPLSEATHRFARLGPLAFAAALATSLTFAGPTVAQPAGSHGVGKPAALPATTRAAAPAATHLTGNAGTSGDVTSPQPISRADSNSGGANGQCPGGAYCSTRDGSPSGNGNGTGAAVGKPCAGCVGKADNKNPQGQRPDGSDPNAGYECDRNHGVGRTNPAHTGCASSTPGCVVTPTNPCTSGGGECVVTATHPCGGTSGSECTPTATVTCGVSGESVTRTGLTTPPASAALAATGSDVEMMLLYGVALLAVGAALASAGAVGLRRRT